MASLGGDPAVRRRKGVKMGRGTDRYRGKNTHIQLTELNIVTERWNVGWS